MLQLGSGPIRLAQTNTIKVSILNTCILRRSIFRVSPEQASCARTHRCPAQHCLCRFKPEHGEVLKIKSHDVVKYTPAWRYHLVLQRYIVVWIGRPLKCGLVFDDMPLLKFIEVFCLSSVKLSMLCIEIPLCQQMLIVQVRTYSLHVGILRESFLLARPRRWE